jgi:hypothetical protein
MKKLVLGLFFILSSPAYAVLDCVGKVERILEWPQQCNGNLAFILDNNKSNGKYVCTLSSKSESMVLAAFMAGKNISFRLGISGETCEGLTSHYLKPTYIHVLSK